MASLASSRRSYTTNFRRLNNPRSRAWYARQAKRIKTRNLSNSSYGRRLFKLKAWFNLLKAKTIGARVAARRRLIRLKFGRDIGGQINRYVA